MYLDVQLQPMSTVTQVNESRLRYNVTRFDWPSDSQGQIQDLDASVFDVELIPVLQLSSPFTPTLANTYGIISVPDEASQRVTLWAPLQPVNNGDDVKAFQTRIAFTPQEMDTWRSVDLTNGQVLWLTQAALDSQVEDPQGNDVVVISNTVVATYPEELIRVVGMNVIQSKDAQVGLFGWNQPQPPVDPNTPDEDTVMFNLASGLGPTFLGYVNPSLAEIQATFEDQTAQLPYSDTWGVDPASVHSRYDAYPHRDAAMATTSMTTTVGMLDTYNTTCLTTTIGLMTPTLVTAYQETRGHLDINNNDLVTVFDGPQGSVDPVSFTFPMSRTGVYVQRNVQMSSYGCVDQGTDFYGVDQAGWQQLGLANALLELEQRYPEQGSDALFGLTELMVIMFLNGQSSIVTVNGQPLSDVELTADPADLSSLYAPGENSLPGYVRSVYNLDDLNVQMSVLGVAQGLNEWAGGITGTVFVANWTKVIMVTTINALTTYVDVSLTKQNIAVASDRLVSYTSRFVLDDTINPAITEYRSSKNLFAGLIGRGEVEKYLAKEFNWPKSPYDPDAWRALNRTDFQSYEYASLSNDQQGYLSNEAQQRVSKMGFSSRYKGDARGEHGNGER